MLERIAGGLIEATESIASEQMATDLVQRGHPAFQWRAWIYIPVIITTARLVACKFDPAHVKLSDGLLPDGATFEDVSVVRFIKNLSATGEGVDLQSANSARDRTVLVVSGDALGKFLQEFQWAQGVPEELRALMI